MWPRGDAGDRISLRGRVPVDGRVQRPHEELVSTRGGGGEDASKGPGGFPTTAA